MSRRITIPKVVGLSSRQAHTDLPDGSYEREMGREGFYGPSTQMYHRHPPTGWQKVEGPLRPRAFDCTRLEDRHQCPWQAPVLLHNPSLELRFWQLDSAMPELARNADGDQLLFIHQGEAELFCDYGHLSLRAGDYLLLPRGTLWRLEPHCPMQILMAEASHDSYGLPERGILGEQAIFDPAILDIPDIDEAFLAQQDESAWRVVVKKRQQLSTLNYPFNPLDALGWHGSLMPVRLNWRDIRPIMSHRYHIPPSVHTTFMCDGFMVCTFVPRPLESDPGALSVPFFHNNEDYDELIFYHRGQFFSRDHIQPGMLTLHPSGITHGPHPKAYEHSKTQAGGEADEVAVMFDTRQALTVPETMSAIEWSAYVDSWKGPLS